MELKTEKEKTYADIMEDVLVFDCETTGLPPKGAKWDENYEVFPNIVQLAWSINGKERSYIIKPEGWEIPEDSVKVHGITGERAAFEGVPFAGIIGEFLGDCAQARLLVGHNIYFDTSIIKAMVLRMMGREYYEAEAEEPLYKGKRIDTMLTTVKFVGALFANGRPGKFPKLGELYGKCFPGETFPAHDALEDVRACMRCVPVLVERGIIELKPKEYPEETQPAPTRQAKCGVSSPQEEAAKPERGDKVAEMLNETEF